MSKNNILGDAMRQIIGRAISAALGIVVVMMISKYLGPYRYGDYTNIIDIFGISATLADFGLYTLALHLLGKLKEENNTQKLQETYSKIVFTRIITIIIVYTITLIVAYQIPAYTSNTYLIRGLPIGALFSAIFMLNNIIQLPLQLFWQMKKVTVALTVARITQLAILAATIRIFATGKGGINLPIRAFLLIIGSVLASAIAQLTYTYYKASKYLTIKTITDRSFSRSIIKKNAGYGLASLLSTIHIAAISIILGIIYPTAQDYALQGIRKLPLGIMMMLIIIPSSIGNSMIHKIANTNTGGKRRAIGALIALMTGMGGIIVSCCIAFAPQIINTIGGAKYITTSNMIGADFLLPRLAVILVGSFIKQCFNYLFLSVGRQNILLTINGVGVALGLPFGIRAVKQRGLMGALRGQGLMEALFLAGSIVTAHYYHIMPKLPKQTIRLATASALYIAIAMVIHHYRPHHNFWISIAGSVFVTVTYLTINYHKITQTTKLLDGENNK